MYALTLKVSYSRFTFQGLALFRIINNPGLKILLVSETLDYYIFIYKFIVCLGTNTMILVVGLSLILNHIHNALLKSSHKDYYCLF